MTMTSYSWGMFRRPSGPQSSSQGGEWNERGRSRLPGRVIGSRRLLGIESAHTRAELAVLVAQLPVRLREPVEPLRQPPRPDERRRGKKKGCAGDQPV